MTSIGSKRSLSQSEMTSGTSTKKRPKMDFDFDVKFIASSQDDLDIGLLRVQNRRLSERLFQRQRIEEELRSRIEQIEKKKLNGDTKLYVINRYWNQLNEDMRLILQRFDSTAAAASNEPTNNNPNQSTRNDNDEEDSTDGEPMEHSRNENAETTSFVRQLANVDKEELDEQLQQRVLLSTRAVSKVLQAFDRIVQRNEKVMSALKDRTTLMEGDDSEIYNPEDESDTIKSPDHDDDEGDLNTERNSKQRKNLKKSLTHKVNLDETVRQLNEELTKENKNLNLLVTSLHEKHHTMSLKYTQLTDELESKDMQLDELKNRIDELEFELNKSRTREQRLEDHLYEAREKLRDFQNNQVGGNSGDNNSSCSTNTTKQEPQSGISSARIEDLKRELEEQREMAQSRLTELEQLNIEHKDTLKLLEKCKIDLQCLPDSVIKDSAEFKSLQSHFSVLFNESMQLKTQLDETRQQLTAAKNVHMRQIEQMEVEELTMQKRLRNECMQLEDSLAQVRKEYEMLRLEFEQTLAANEQTGPINREMRHLITSLQNHTQQLKGENARIKKKLKESNVEIGRLKHIIEQNGLKVCCGGILLPTGQKPVDNGASTICAAECCNNTPTSHNVPGTGQNPKSENIKSDSLIHQVSCSDSSNEGTTISLTTNIKSEELTSGNIEIKHIKSEEKTNKLESSTSSSLTPPHQQLSMPSVPLTPTTKKESPSLDLGIIESSNIEYLTFSEDNSQSTQMATQSNSNVLSSITPNNQSHQRPQQAQSATPQQQYQQRKTEDNIRELKFQLKKSWEAQRELKILLDMFKSVDKEKRDKSQLMAQEKKLRCELDELRQQNKKLIEENSKRSSSGAGGQERRFSGSGKTMSDEDYKKINKYEDIIKELQKNVSIHKQQEEALLNEMEVTGQAFEDMQEQNCRLIQQLREKDDANFKLMSERIKSNQIHKLLKEEKDMLTEQIVSLQQQIETQNQVVRKLEDKERMLQNSLSTTEKELALRQQAMDFLKRKALESSQSAADLKLHLDKYVAQIKDAQSIVADKTSAWQQETFKTKRLHEEVMMYKRKYERAKKFELAATADEVLQEEIRELREELTCPSCKTKRKDAVLNKCFHVFCYDCLKARYETRQRKCPKCNQSFSANDFHRLYLA